MINFVKILFIFGLAGAVIYYAPGLIKTVCDEPLKYSIGNFDKEFGLSREEFKNNLIQAEEVWEKRMGLQLFAYDETASFKVNLVFDERQRATQEAEESRSEIEDKGSTYESLAEQYESLKSDFQTRLVTYEDNVAYWNSRGGAPEKEYQALQQEQNELKNMSAELNILAGRINSFAEEYNEEISLYNEKFNVPRTFDQGHYDGKQINVFQFEEKEDLLLVLAHEFGHALNLDHVDDKQAIMYYLMKDQKSPISLTSADLQALKKECRLD